MLSGMTGVSLSTFTLLLAVGASARLTRLVMTDHLGMRWIITPALAWVDRKPEGRRSALVIGLWCPFCVGFWIGCLILGSLWAVGGPASEGPLAEGWRWIAGAFTLNYVAGHLNRTLDPVLTDEDVPSDQPSE